METTARRRLELLDRGDLDLAILGSTPYASSVARGAKVTAVSVLKNIAGSEGVVACEQVDRLQAMRGKIFMAPYASTAHYTLLATIVEAGIDVNEVTVLTRAPAEIVAAWDAGEIHGGAYFRGA